MTRLGRKAPSASTVICSIELSLPWTDMPHLPGMAGHSPSSPLFAVATPFLYSLPFLLCLCLAGKPVPSPQIRLLFSGFSCILRGQHLSPNGCPINTPLFVEVVAN